jgi:hypothetical protein
LKQRYGLEDGDITILRREEAAIERIRAEIRRAAQTTTPAPTLFVMIGLGDLLAATRQIDTISAADGPISAQEFKGAVRHGRYRPR